jgi:hypothetical protein
MYENIHFSNEEMRPENMMFIHEIITPPLLYNIIQQATDLKTS